MKKILICFLSTILIVMSMFSCGNLSDKSDNVTQDSIDEKLKDYPHSINFSSFSDAVDFIYNPSNAKYSAYEYHKSAYDAMCQSLKEDGFFYTVDSSFAEMDSSYSYAITLSPSRKKYDAGTRQGVFYHYVKELHTSDVFAVYVKTIDESLMPFESFAEYIDKKGFASDPENGVAEIFEIDKSINDIFTENLCYIPHKELFDADETRLFIVGGPNKTIPPDNLLIGKIDDIHYIYIESQSSKEVMLEFAKSLSITKVYFDAYKD